ncbi:MAG: 16S rRNA (guanine(527)-N(7))-methyltransferase RsmG [Burkholderiaceae bacterium]
MNQSSAEGLHAEGLRALLCAQWQACSPGSPRLSLEQSTQLIEFAELLQHWNRVHSLTAVEGLADTLQRHLIDALRAWPGLARRLADQAEPRCCDVGSGTGVPGLPLALVMPGLQMDLVERVARKAAFLRHAAARLGLASRVAVHQQDVTRLSPSRPYEMIVSRAFAPLENFLEWTFHLSGPGTTWLYMAGKLNEIKHLKGDRYQHPRLAGRLDELSVEAVGGPGPERHLIWIRRLS